ncbi:MAG: mechanosensitive ion channel [Planctomycetes bacterium]|nr:mechanosensitive ion channel [Planctomycetota bacterium]
MTNRKIIKVTTYLFVISVLFAISIVHHPMAIAQNTETANEQHDTPTRSLQQITLFLEKTQSRLESIPEEVPEESHEGKLRLLLKKQVVVIEELMSVLEKDETFFSISNKISQPLEEKEREFASLQSIQHEINPNQPNQEEFDALAKKTKQLRKAILDIKEEINRYDKLTRNAPELTDKAEKKRLEAEDLIPLLKEQILATANAKDKELLQLRLDIAEVESQIGSAVLKSLKSKLDRIEEVRPLLVIELESSDKRLVTFVKELEIYGETLEQGLKDKRHESEKVLARKVAQAAKADTPQKVFIAKLETKLAFSHKSKIALEEHTIIQQRILDELDRKLQTEKDKVQYLTNRLERLGASSIPAELIKRELKRLEKLKDGLKNRLPADYKNTVERCEAREFEIDDALLNFSEIWHEDLLQIPKNLSNAEKAAFEEKASSIIKEYKESINEEKEILSKFFELDLNINRHLLERGQVLAEIERTVRSCRFWIQDGMSINLGLIKKLPVEIQSSINRIKNLEYANIVNALLPVLWTLKTISYGVLLFIVLPVLLFFLRIRLVKFVTKYNQKTLEMGRKWQNKIAAVLGGIVSAITLSAYFFLFSRIIGNAGIPGKVGNLFELVFLFSGIFLLLFFLNRSFFRRHGIAPVQFGLYAESSRIIYLSLQIIIISGVTLRLLTTITHSLMIPATTELLLFLELIIQGVVIWWALRSKSPLIQRKLVSQPPTFLSRYWTLISFTVFSIIVVTWILSIAGYSYAATQFSRSLLASIVVAFLLPQVYKFALQSIETLALKRRQLIWIQTRSKEEEVDKKEDEVRLTSQAKSFVRVFFYITGAFIVFNIWGLDDGAFKTFDGIGVYHVTTGLDEKEMVSVADLLRLLIVVLVSTWFLKNLRGITEYTIFPRLKLDDGLKYTILTITRYCVIFIAALLVLSTIHLDLGRLKWLVAAMGVGLGFGLQEIVLNFVSGIILLIERPIRVSDVVTVGNNIGTVTHINIRATTIINFDRQELIVPNRMLITQEITNWTRGDNIIRLIVPIGVAYGTNLDKVCELLLTIVKDHPVILEDPVPCVFFMGHGESSLDFELRVFLPNPMVKFDVLDAINKEINRKLSENDIEIPFPQRDIHIKTATRP